MGALDPRYQPNYEALPAHRKCAEMIRFLSTIVANMRPHLNFADPANPRAMPESIGTVRGNWSLGFGHPGNAVLRLYPNRTALAFNIALVDMAGDALREGDDIYFNGAFLGIGGIDPCGSGFGIGICERIELMLPLRRKDLARYLRQHVLPDRATRAMLGPALTSKIVLGTPWLEWMICANGEDDKIKLPSGLLLERFDKDVVKEAMDNWDPTDDGRYDSS